MGILIQNRKKQTRLKETSLREKTILILNALGYNSAELSVVITDDEEIKKLNLEFRGKDQATNVLSFPMMDEDLPDIGIDMLGDIVISEETALREAMEAEITLEERVSQLVVHGVLHLVGYDHEISEEEDVRMTKKSEELIFIIEKNENLSHWM